MVVSTDFNFKRVFLTGTIFALCAAALVGILALLFELKHYDDELVLFSVLVVEVYCVTGLCCSVLYEKKRWAALPLVGIGTSLLAMISSLLMIWDVIDPFANDFPPLDNLSYALIFGTLSFVVAVTCLLLLIRSKSATVNQLLFATIVCISIVTLMVIYYFADGYSSFSYDFEYTYLKITGVFGILSALGTIVTPILHKMHPAEHAKRR